MSSIQIKYTVVCEWALFYYFVKEYFDTQEKRWFFFSPPVCYFVLAN